MPGRANHLQLKDFRLIQAIADTGQLALAAERLAINQPVASRMLAAIERQVGASIFVRHPKGMTPTAIGETLAHNANGLLRSYERTVQETQAAIAGRSGTVRVGAVTGAAVGFVVPAIHELKQSVAGADIHVDVAPSSALIAGLLRGDFDFVLSRITRETDPRQFSLLPGRKESVCFLARRQHPLTDDQPLDLQKLADHEWVIQAPHTPMRQAIEEAFFARSVPLPAEIVNTTSLLVMTAYLASTDAVAPVSKEVADLVAPNAEHGSLVTLRLEERITVEPYHLISMKHQTLSPLAHRLLELVFHALSPGPRDKYQHSSSSEF